MPRRVPMTKRRWKRERRVFAQLVREGKKKLIENVERVSNSKSA